MGGVLLQGGCVLSLDRRIGNLERADVRIEGDRIAEIGTGLRARDVETIDASDTIVMPGFVDAHRHTWRTLLRGLGATSAPDARGTVERYGRHYEPDDVYAATLVGLLSACAAGVTSVVDWADIVRDERYLEAALQAHADAGIRTVLVHGQPSWGDPSLDPVPRASTGAPGQGPLTTVAFGAPDISLDAVDQLAASLHDARRRGLRVHSHARPGETDRGAVTALAGTGALGEDVTVSHCSHLGDADLDALAASGARVCLAPTGEMATGFGPPPLQRLLDRSIRPGLGVDDELAAPGDVFAQMRATQSLQHATVFDRKLAGKAGLPQLLNTREVIRYATVDGANAAGLGDVTGTLSPGRQADVVTLRTDRANISPVNDPIGAVVWGMDASNVDLVLVAGRTLVRDGALQADVARARELAEVARQRLERAAGELVTDGGPR